MKELNYLDVCELFLKTFDIVAEKEPRVICVKTYLYVDKIRDEIRQHILESESFLDTLDDFLFEKSFDLVTFGEIHSDGRGHLLFEDEIIREVPQILNNQYYLMD